MSASFVLATLLVFGSSHILSRLFYIIAAGWLGFFYFFLWAACLCWITYGLAKIFNVSFDAKLMAEIFLSLAIIVGVYGIINANNVRVSRLTVKLPNLPADWKGKTAVWTSDLHLGPVRSYGFAVKTANKIKELNPDIVFIGGDFYDGEAADLERLVEPFGRLNAPYGIYFVTGNHEEFRARAPYLEAVRKAGIIALDNSMVNVNGLQIAGVDYFDTRDKEKFRAILKSLNINKDEPSILLKHSSFNMGVAAEEGISFQLSGHTHAGQIFPANIVTHYIFKGYDYGLGKSGNLINYTSSGTGTWGIPMRWWTRPEVVFITFQ